MSGQSAPAGSNFKHLIVRARTQAGHDLSLEIVIDEEVLA
jgi:hypothetical protein